MAIFGYGLHKTTLPLSGCLKFHFCFILTQLNYLCASRKNRIQKILEDTNIKVDFYRSLKHPWKNQGNPVDETSKIVVANYTHLELTFINNKVKNQKDK